MKLTLFVLYHKNSLCSFLFLFQMHDHYSEICFCRAFCFALCFHPSSLSAGDQDAASGYRSLFGLLGTEIDL